MVSKDKTSKELRNFGFLFSIFIIFFTKFILGFIFEIITGLWPFVIAIIITLSAIIIPKVLILLYVPWMKLTNILHLVNTHFIIGIIFYLLITPTGIIMRLIGRNPMKNNKLHTYRISSYARDKNHIERPY